jgi:ribonuclease P protein component
LKIQIRFIKGRELFAVPKTHPSLGLPHRVRVIYTYGLPLSHLIQSGAGIFDAETYISTQQAQALEEAWVPDSYEDEEWSCCAVAPPGQRAQACFSGAGFPRLVFQPRTAKRPSLLLVIVQDCELVSADAPKPSVKPPTAQVGASFPSSARLLKHSDFDRVYKQGRRHFSSHLTVFYLRRSKDASPNAALPETGSAEPSARVGFTVGRILGGAVERNRIKRRLREAVRRQRAVLQSACSVDVVINPKKSVLTLEFSVVLEEVGRALDAIAKKLSEK